MAFRAVVLTGDPQTWWNAEVAGARLDVCRSFVSGQRITSEVFPLRDYDLFIVAGLGTAKIDGIQSWQDALPILDQVRSGPTARFVIVMDTTTLSSGILNFFRGNVASITPPSHEMTFDSSALGRELSRHQTSLQVECEWPLLTVTVGRNKQDNAIADYADKFLLLPSFRHDVSRASIVPQIINSLRGWLPLTDANTTAERLAWSAELHWPALDAARSSSMVADAAVEVALQRQIDASNAVSNEFRWSELVWASGKDVLEPAVRDALRILGIAVEDPVDSSREDLRYETNDGVWVIEVTGSNKTIEIDKTRQLMDWVDGEEVRQAEAGTSKPVTGILIGNAFRETSPQERMPDFYTDSARNLANRRGLRLLRSTDLFDFVISPQPDLGAVHSWLLGA